MGQVTAYFSRDQRLEPIAGVAAGVVDTGDFLGGHLPAVDGFDTVEGNALPVQDGRDACEAPGIVAQVDDVAGPHGSADPLVERGDALTLSGDEAEAVIL